MRGEFSEMMHERPHNAWHILTAYSVCQQLDSAWSPVSLEPPLPPAETSHLISLLNWSLKQENNAGIVVTLPVIFKHIVLYKYSSPLHEDAVLRNRVCVQTNVYARHYIVMVPMERCPGPLFVAPIQLLFSSQPFTWSRPKSSLPGSYYIPRDHFPGCQGRRNILRGRLSASWESLLPSFPCNSASFHPPKSKWGCVDGAL